MRQIINHKLFKIFGLNSIAVFVKMVTMFFWVKLQAIFIGAEGFALVGDFKNFSGSTKTISTFGFDNGIVSLVSKNKNNLVELRNIYSTAFFSRLFFSGLISLGLVVFASNISELLLGGKEVFRNVIYLFATVVPFYTVNSLFLAILNGLGEFKRLIIVNVISSLVGFAFSFLLLYWFNFNGVLISVAVVESLIVIVTFLFVRKLKIVFSFQFVEVKILKKLLSFSTMTLVSAVIVPFSSIYIRNLIKNKIGLEEAGFWEALNRFSGYYMLAITSTIGMYYLPKIARINDRELLRKEFNMYAKVFGLSFLVVGFCIYLFRNNIVALIFSKEFQPVSDLILFQLVGDFIKIFVLFFGYKMIADGDVKKYLITEFSFYGLYIFLCINFLTKFLHVKYVVLSYGLSYLFSAILMFLFYWNCFVQKRK